MFFWNSLAFAYDPVIEDYSLNVAVIIVTVHYGWSNDICGFL